MILESLILIKCGGILSLILIKCADVAVLVRVSAAAVAAGCGGAGAAWTQGLMSTAAQVRARLGILRSVQDAGRAVTMQSPNRPTSLVVSPVSVSYVDITTGCRAFYRFGRVVTSDGAESLYRVRGGRSIDRFRLVLSACRFRSIGVATFCGRSPDPLGDFGRSTWAARSTDIADSVDRLCPSSGDLPASLQ